MQFEPRLLAPIEGSYWVVPSKLLAGPHPGMRSDSLDKLLASGIEVFIDLTIENEDYLANYKSRLNPVHHSFPIRDYSVPSSKLFVKEILDTIDAALSEDKKVYVHCHGGIGRTGTIIGCWLTRHPKVAAPGDALKRLCKLRKHAGISDTRSPETDEQADFVRAWEHCCDTSLNHS